jgi:hypothetical protein
MPTRGARATETKGSERMKCVGTFVRLAMTGFLLVLIWRNVYWVAALAITCLTIDAEISQLQFRRLNKK